MTTAQATEAPDTIPVFRESMAGALIDSARISVMAALAMLPPPEVPLIIMPGSEPEVAGDAAATTEGCLEQAMQWLDAFTGIQTRGSRLLDGLVPCRDSTHIWSVDGEWDDPQPGERCHCGKYTWTRRSPFVTRSAP